MSNNVDERIVDMQFNNGEFEKGIQESLKSLEALKKGLELDKSAKSLDNLNKLVSNVDFSSMAKGIESISSRFSTMGVAGMRAIQNITDRVMAMSERMIRSVTVDQISAGFSKYAQKTEAVQTIMSATGKSIEEVEKVLGKLNEYTDWTSFNFAEMTTTIGKFTSSGVDLETAERAMEGIGNEASLAGATIQNANHAMYNFAQALATGKVQLMDWKSIENANMATKQFKETIIDTAVELGTLKRGTDGVSKTAKGTTVDFAKFNATLSEGWFTSDVLIKSLEKYADTSTDLGKKAFEAAKKAITFGQAIDSVKDAVSTGWMNTFQLVFGNFEEASELWTGFADGLIDVLDKFTQSRNELLEGWRDLNGEDGRQILLDGLVEIYQVLSDIFGMVGRVVKEFFPPLTSERLMAISKGVKEFADGLYEAVHATEILMGGSNSLFSAGGPELNLKGNMVSQLEKLEKLLKRGDSSEEVKKLQERLIELGYETDVGIADGIFGPKTQAALMKFQKEAGIAVDGIYGKESHEAIGKALAKDLETVETPMERVEEYVYNLTEGLTTLQRIARGFFAVVHVGANIGTFVLNVIKSVFAILKPLGEVILNVAAVIGDCLVEFDSWVTQSGILESALAAVQSVLKPFGDWISKISKSIIDFLTTGDKIKSFADLWNKFKAAFEKTDFGKSLSEAFERIKNTKFFESFSKFLSGIQGKLKNFVNWIKFLFNWTKSGAKPMGKYTAAIDKFRQIVGKVKEVFSNLPTKLVDFGVAIYDFAKGLIESAKESTVIQSFIGNIQKFFSLLNGGLSSFITNVPSYLNGIKSFFSGLFPKNVDFKSASLSLGDKIKNAFFKAISFIKDPSEWSSAFDKVKPFLKKIENGLSEFYQVVVTAVSKFLSGNTLEEKMEAFSGVIDWFKSKWESIVSKLKSLFSGFNGGDSSLNISGALSGMNLNFESIGSFFKSVRESLPAVLEYAKDFTPILYGVMKGLLVLLALRKVSKFLSSASKGVLIIAKGFGGIGKSISGLFKSVGKNIKGFRKDAQPLALSVLEIGGAIALIAGAIYVLAQLKTDQLIRGGVAIAAIGVVLVAITALAKKFAGGSADLGQLGIGLLGVAGAIAALAAIALIMHAISWGTLLDGLVKVIAISAVLSVVVSMLAKVTKGSGALKGAASLIGITVALGLLAIIAKMVGGMKTEELYRGLFRLILVSTLLSSFAKSLSKVSKKYGKATGGFNLIGIVLALGAFALMAKTVSKIKAGELYKGLLRLWAISKLMTLVLKGISKATSGAGLKGTVSGSIGLLGMVAALYGLAGLVKVVASISTGDLVKGLAGLSILALVIKSLAKTADIMSKISIGSSVSAVGSFAVFAAGVTGVVAILNTVLGAINEITSGKFGELLSSGGEALGGIIGGFIHGVMSALKGEGGDTSPKEGKTLVEHFSEFLDELEGVSGKLSSTFDSFKPFFDQIGSVEDSVYNGMNTLVQTMLLMTGEGVLESISKLFTDGEGGLSVFADSMAELAPKLNGMGSAAAMLDESTSSNILKLVEPMNSLSEIAKASAIGTIVGTLDNLAAMVTGKDNLASFVDSVSGLTGKLVALGNAASEVGEGTGSNIEKLAGPMNGLSSLCGSILGIVGTEVVSAISSWVTSALVGEDNALEGFIDNMITVAPKLAQLATACADIPGDGGAISKLVAPMEALSGMGGALMSATWSEVIAKMGDFITGDNNLETFLDKMTTAAPKMAALAGELKDVKTGDAEKIDFAASVIGSLADAASKIPAEGGLLQRLMGEINVEGFSIGMGQLADGLNTFVTALQDTSDVKYDELSGPTDIIGKLVELEDSLTAHGGFAQIWSGEKDIGTFGERVATLGSQFKSFSDDISGLELGGFTEFITALEALQRVSNQSMYNDPDAAFSMLEQAIGALDELVWNGDASIVTRLESIGKGIVGSIQNGMSNSDGFEGGSVFAMIANSLSSASAGYSMSFESIGANIIAGLVRGIQRHTFEAVSAMESVMNRVRRAAAAVVEIESPSRVFMDMGMYIDQGLAIGLNKYAHVAERAGATVMDSTLASTQNTLSNLSTIVNSGMDLNPTITPVLDLSNVTANAGRLSGILGGVGIGANLNFRGIGSTSLADKYGNTDVVNAINSLNDRMNDMATAISNMQVVMETGALVGQISTAMDEELGGRAARRRRMG